MFIALRTVEIMLFINRIDICDCTVSNETFVITYLLVMKMKKIIIRTFWSSQIICSELILNEKICT